MIVWLASYPRSGNTALRILLNRVFGLQTFSLYDDLTDIGSTEEHARFVGHQFHGSTAEAFAAEAAASEETHYVKTHELPQPGQDWPAIVVVRDGRSSIVSYRHYLNRFSHKSATLEQVVVGDVLFGSWSAHVAAWLDAPLSRRLVLRFEDVTAPTPDTVARIADFLGVTPKEFPSGLRFKEAHQAFPEFFRGGDDAKNVAELEAACPSLFEALHGSVQRRLGYQPATTPVDAPNALAIELARALAIPQAEATNLAAEANNFRNERDQLHAEREQLCAEIASLREENASLSGEIASLREENASLSGKIASLREENASLSGEIASLREENASLSGENASLSGENASLSGENASLSGEIVTLQARVDEQALCIEGMQSSPFWKLREETIKVLRITGLRRPS